MSDVPLDDWMIGCTLGKSAGHSNRANISELSDMVKLISNLNCILIYIEKASEWTK